MPRQQTVAPPRPGDVGVTAYPTAVRPMSAGAFATAPVAGSVTGGVSMSVRRPTLDQMRDIVAGRHMHLSGEELPAYMRGREGNFLHYDRIKAQPDQHPAV